jgi:DNA-directed RNA polymerase subunit RPC12/RpoP
MIVFPCHVCRTQLSAEDQYTGQLVRCPTCLTATRVPAQSREPQPVPAAVGGAGDLPPPPRQQPPPRPPALNNPFRGGVTGGKRYGFNCPYCSSRLEATEAIAAQEGQCPTCGNNIVIPILDRYGRLIDPRTQQIIKQDPHPVHAYAAAGDRAPRILRNTQGVQHIVCPRCNALSPMSANNCNACGMPFTMEGTTVDATGASNGFCVASLVLGIVGLPASCAVIPSILAIVFGVIGLTQANKEGAESGGKGMAIAGIILGAVGCVIAVTMYLK